MKKAAMICWMFALVGGLVFGSGSRAGKSEQAVLEELMALTRASLDDWYGQSDPTIFATGFADKATYYDPWVGGRLDDGAISEYLMAFLGQVPKVEYDIPDPRVDLHGETAILTFVCNSTDPKTGVTTPWNVTEIFIRSSGGWKRVHANWSYTTAPAS